MTARTNRGANVVKFPRAGSFATYLESERDREASERADNAEWLACMRDYINGRLAEATARAEQFRRDVAAVDVAAVRRRFDAARRHREPFELTKAERAALVREESADSLARSLWLMQAADRSRREDQAYRARRARRMRRAKPARGKVE